MGNRAHVIFTDGEQFSPAVYLHWNGSAESVYPFLEELRERMGDRISDPSYSAARFCGLVADFFGLKDGLSLGLVNGPADDSLEELEPFDHGDNGVFLIDVRADKVRRFTSGACGTLNEWTADQVAREKVSADRHAHHDGLAEFFAAFRKLRGPRGRMI